MASQLHDPLSLNEVPSAAALNSELIEAFQHYQDHPDSRKSHYFGGRYENIYLSRAQVPVIERLIRFAEQCAAGLLGCSSDSLQTGFWFNEMGVGHATLPHRHDDDDELLSGAYYVAVPYGSGNFVYRNHRETAILVPRAGQLILFPPDLEHWVTENNSQRVRLSIGMNIGPKKTANPD